MILNPMNCEKCKRGLQPENLGVKIEGETLIKVCGFCGHEVKVEGKN